MPSDLNRLRRVPILATLGDGALSRFAALATKRSLDTGARASMPGEAAAEVGFLLEGRLKIVRTSRRGHSAIMRIVHPGELFGLTRLMGSGRLPDIAQALCESRVALWPATAWQRLAEKNPEAALELIRLIGRKLDEAHEHILDISTLDVRQRLVHMLLRLVDQAGRTEADGTRIDVPLSRQDLAAMTGTTLHNVSRILSGWERQGLIEAGRRTILVRDIPTLVRLATTGDGSRRDDRAAE